MSQIQSKKSEEKAGEKVLTQKSESSGKQKLKEIQKEKSNKDSESITDKKNQREKANNKIQNVSEKSDKVETLPKLETKIESKNQINETGVGDGLNSVRSMDNMNKKVNYFSNNNNDNLGKIQFSRTASQTQTKLIQNPSKMGQDSKKQTWSQFQSQDHAINLMRDKMNKDYIYNRFSIYNNQSKALNFDRKLYQNKPTQLSFDYDSRYTFLNAEYGKDKEKQYNDYIENIQKVIQSSQVDFWNLKKSQNQNSTDPVNLYDEPEFHQIFEKEIDRLSAVNLTLSKRIINCHNPLLLFK